MVLRRPLGEFVDEGRSARERRDDEQKFERLVELLPIEDVRSAVLEFYASPPTDTIAASFACSEDILREIIADVQTPEKASSKELEEVILAILRGSADPTTDNTLVEEEAQTARREIPTYWVNAVLLAWEQLGPDDPSGLVLSKETLLPLPRKENPWRRWNETVAEYRDQLVWTLALSSAGFDGLLAKFCAGLSDRWSQVELPGGFTLKRSLALRSENRTLRLVSTR